MSATVRHTVSEPKKPFWQNILYVMVVVLGINLLVEFTNFLPKGMAAIVSVLILIFAAGFSSFLINRKLAQYTYILIADELIFIKQVGKRENKVLNLSLHEIEWIKPIGEVTEKKKCEKIYSLACKLKGKGVYMGQFKKENKLYRFIFQPNEALCNAIKRQVQKSK